MKSVTVKAPAKLNLTLDILGTDNKGYHLMDMIMQTVSLYETVQIQKCDDIVLTFENSTVPTDKNNTAYKAAVEFFKTTGLLAGARICINKQVPIRAGMAGGSADAAGVLVGLNELYSAKLTQHELCKIGERIGADVPFCIVGGTAHVGGIGEIIKSIAPCPTCYFTVCMPQMGVSTPQAFARYDEMGTDKRPNTKKAVEAIAQNNLHMLCENMHNVMQFSSESRHNSIICNTLQKHGALAALMTGSGAAVFGVFNVESKAQSAKEELLKSYNTCHVLTPEEKGARVIE